MAETGKPDYILEPRYILELYFARTGTKVRVDDPALINDEIIASAWSMMNDFVMDVIDALQIEATDEKFREIFIEICYMLVFREMKTLHLLPFAEQLFQYDLTRKRRSKRSKGES